jgi:adenylate cyclase, class 2
LPLETEVKIRVSTAGAARKRLRELGYKVHARRVFESNIIIDTADRRLGAKGELLRIRRAGRLTLVTYKGPSQDGPHKIREEIQTTAGDAAAMEEIFARLGLQTVFRYEKYRTEYSRRGAKGIITVDETPIGVYLEIEGEPRWIDASARELGYSRSEYIIKSYGALYREYCGERGIEPSDMVFEAGQSRIARANP